MTHIAIPGKRGGWGLTLYGRLPAAEMVKQYRAHIDELRAQVAAADATPDEGFDVVVARGSIVQRHVETLQQGCSALVKGEAA